MLFQIDESDRFESAYADLLERIGNAMQQTYHEEQEAHGLTKTAIADVLGIDLSVVSRRLNGIGNITLRTISDTYTAMGREPLSNFAPPIPSVEENDNPEQYRVGPRAKVEPVLEEVVIRSKVSRLKVWTPDRSYRTDPITHSHTIAPIGTFPLDIEHAAEAA